MYVTTCHLASFPGIMRHLQRGSSTVSRELARLLFGQERCSDSYRVVMRVRRNAAEDCCSGTKSAKLRRSLAQQPYGPARQK